MNNPSITNPVACPTTGTNYYLTVTDANGCTGTSTLVPVFINLTPTISIAPVTSLCVTGNTTLAASGGVTYVWAPGGQSTTSIVASTTATGYTVTGTDQNGCSSTAATFISTDCPDFLYEDCRIFLDKSVFSSYPSSVMAFFKIAITEYATPTAQCTGTVTNTIAYTTQPTTSTPWPFDAITPVNPTSPYPNLILPPGHTPIDLTTNYGYSPATASWLGPLAVGHDFKVEMYGSLTSSGTYTLVGNADCITPVSWCAQVTKTIEPQSNASKGSEAAKISYSVYPNPANSNITLSYSLPENELGVFELHDVFGKLCFKQNLQSGKKLTQIDVSNLNSGIYYCGITMGNSISEVKKLIIMK